MQFPYRGRPARPSRPAAGQAVGRPAGAAYPRERGRGTRAGRGLHHDRGAVVGGDEPAQDGGAPSERAAHAHLLHCIFRNPFRPVAVSPAWQTPQVVSPAQAAWDEREMPAGTLDVARLAVLADALEEAGCTDQAILDHLRGPGPHVSGCCAVDLLLGKS
jgi:hypothetical protein